MTFELNKIDPIFRQLTDLLCFSDRTDLDLSNYNDLYKSNRDNNLEYIWDRFTRSSNTYWIHDYWFDRLSFFLSLNDKILSKRIESFLEKKFLFGLRYKPDFDIRYDIEYLQYVQFCHVKHLRKETLKKFKSYLIKLPSHMSTEKVLDLIYNFTPYIFKDINDYIRLISSKVIHSPRNYLFLLDLEKNGAVIDRASFLLLIKSIIENKDLEHKHIQSVFTFINDPILLSLLKNEYNKQYRDKLLSFLKKCSDDEIEGEHFANIKNLLSLDKEIADDLLKVYINKLYGQFRFNKKNNIKRLIRLLKMMPEFSPKKALAHLSSNNKTFDIKYMMRAFPELKNLSLFV